MEFLKGKKTYIVAMLAGIITFLQAASLIDAGAAQSIYALLGAFGLATLRAGVSGK